MKFALALLAMAISVPSHAAGPGSFFIEDQRYGTVGGWKIYKLIAEEGRNSSCEADMRDERNMSVNLTFAPMLRLLLVNFSVSDGEIYPLDSQIEMNAQFGTSSTKQKPWASISTIILPASPPANRGISGGFDRPEERLDIIANSTSVAFTATETGRRLQTFELADTKAMVEQLRRCAYSLEG